MAKYQKYTEYKDSGVEWLGEIPSAWELLKLKYAVDLISEKSQDSNHKYVGMENIASKNGKYIHTEEVIPEGVSNTFKDADVLFGKLRPYLAKSWLANFSGICSSEFLVLRANEVCPKFLQYYTLTDEFINQVDSSTYGSKMPRASWDFIGLLPIPKCSFDLSIKIANFLDHETAQIDTLIAKQEKLIELLKEKRQAVISHAVTKGLNPDVTMKDSGVEWLGQVPEHWVVSFIKYILAKAKDAMVDGPFGSSVNTATDYVEDGIPVIRTVNITNQGFSSENLKFMRISKFEELKRHSVKTGDVLFSKVGTIGNACIFPENMGVGILSTTGSCKISTNEDLIDRDFLVFQIHCMNQELTQIANANVQPFLNMTNIKNLRISLPSLDEQKSIISLLKSKLDSFDRLIAKAESAIQLMQERRTALISAAVTGKIDVRNWQHPNEAKKGLSA